MVSVQLPIIAVESKPTPLQVELRTSLRFGAGSLGTKFPSASDLQRTRRSGEEEEEEEEEAERVWIVPAPACRLAVSVCLLGQVAGEQLDKEAVAEWIGGCNIWHRLGLGIRYCPADGDTTTLEFSLEHPDLSASLLCPSTAAKVELEKINCCFELSTALKSRRGRKRKRDADGAVREMTARQDAAFPSHTLNGRDCLAVESFVSELGFDGGGCYSTSGGSGTNCGKKTMQNLVGAAVTALATGSTRHFADTRLNQSIGTSCLVKMAPSVFSSQYIKSVSERVQHMAVIANAVMAMLEAQSPRLRRKVECLAGNGASCSRENINKSVWKCIISNTKVPSVPAPKVGAAPTDELVVEYEEDEPIVSDYSSNVIEMLVADGIVDESIVWEEDKPIVSDYSSNITGMLVADGIVNESIVWEEDEPIVSDYSSNVTERCWWQTA